MHSCTFWFRKNSEADIQSGGYNLDVDSVDAHVNVIRRGVALRCYRNHQLQFTGSYKKIRLKYSVREIPCSHFDDRYSHPHICLSSYITEKMSAVHDEMTAQSHANNP